MKFQIVILCLCARAVAGPYSSGQSNTNPGAVDPAVPGFIGSDVNPAFVGWATGVASYLPAPGVDGAEDGTGWADKTHALGPIALTDDPFDIVSLGDLNAAQIAAGMQPGQITLSFNGGIRNKTGADFAVFENALGSQSDVFAELAYVEVSSDGMHFARFPNQSGTAAAVGPYGSIDPTKVHNLAGKHVNSYGNSYGTPFDLSDLTTNSLVQSGQVNLRKIQFVRLMDVPGNGSFSDSNAHSIYDAWLTFGSGGFDLDAIGVLNPWMPGDANFDGIVDSNDLSILALHWQGLGDFTQGDFDLSGRVDIGDAYILASNWGVQDVSFAAAFSQMVPEPHAIGLLIVVLTAIRRRR